MGDNRTNGKLITAINAIKTFVERDDIQDHKTRMAVEIRELFMLRNIVEVLTDQRGVFEDEERAHNASVRTAYP